MDDRLIASHELLEFAEKIALDLDHFLLASPANAHFLSSRFKEAPRTTAHDRPPPAGIRALGALEEKRVLAITNLEISRQGSLKIGRQLGIDRHDIPLPRECAELFQRWFDGRNGQGARA